MDAREPWPRLSLRLVGGVIVAVLIARLVFAAVIPLTEDEAYYRLWSMRLQWGYFDHPPMIAWWIAAGRFLVGDSAVGVRLVPVLASAVMAVLLIDTLRCLGTGERTALRAGLWVNAALLIGIGGLLAVPDAPASLFWVGTVWAISRAVRPDRASTALGWWALAGLAAGLAVLSKYSALFLGVGILLWLCATAENRRRLASSGPLVAAAVALVVVTPHIVWNATHDWVSVLKQFGRVEPKAFRPEFLGELVAGQFVLLNPIIAVFVAVAVIRHRAMVLGTPVSLLLLSTLPFLAYLLVHGLHDRVQAHWPVPVYPALVALAAIAAEGDGAGQRIGGRWRRAVPLVGMGGAALVLIFAALPMLDRFSGKAVQPLRGWTAFAASLQVRTRDPSSGPAAWIGTASYGLAAKLAAEPRLSVPVVQLNDRARYDHLPPVKPPDFGRPGLVVDLPRRVSAIALNRCFAEVEPLAPIRRALPHGSGTGTVYSVFRVSRPIRDVSGGCWRERPL